MSSTKSMLESKKRNISTQSPAAEERGLEITGLRKAFRRKGSREEVLAIDGISLSVREGELVVLLGPSGCGKTTILRSVAGLENPDGGEIKVDGVTVYSEERSLRVPPNKRKMSVIFQSYALWPHMTVAENVAYPLRSTRDHRHTDIATRVQESLDIVGLGHLGREYPSTLSGGQQQRVSLARALVTHPSVILFDEPLSNVDAQVRYTLRQEIANMHRRINFSALYVTHDQEEALALADRIVVLNGGRIVQVGTPTEIYHQPATKYVAEFVGRANILPGVAASSIGSAEVFQAGPGSIYVDSENAAVRPTEGDTGFAVIRAENVKVSRPDGGSSAPNTFPGVVVGVQFLGARTELLVQLVDGTKIRSEIDRNHFVDGDQVECSFAASDVRWVTE